MSGWVEGVLGSGPASFGARCLTRPVRRRPGPTHPVTFSQCAEGVQWAKWRNHDCGFTPLTGTLRAAMVTQ